MPEQDTEQAVADFNTRYPVGTEVRYWPGARNVGPGAVSRTRTVAQIIGGHTAVVWIEARGDCIALTHVEVL